MRRYPIGYLAVIGLALMLGTLGYWALMGGHSGWTQNRIPRQTTDEVTGLIQITYEDRFLPGVDLLFAGCSAGVILLFSASFLHRRQKNMVH